MLYVAPTKRGKLYVQHRIVLMIKTKKCKRSHSKWNRMMILLPTFCSFLLIKARVLFSHLCLANFSFSCVNNNYYYINISQGFIPFETFSLDVFDHNNSAIILVIQMVLRGAKEENQ